MRLKILGVFAAVAASAVVLGVACGEPSGGGGDYCSSDSSCGDGEICHPKARVCVKTCSAAADCPSEAKTCNPIDGAASGDAGSGGQNICQCATDQLCNDAVSGTICSTLDKVCVPKCTSNDDCSSGRTCNTSTGQCEEGSGGGDAGACTWSTCSTASFTSAGQMCGTSGCAAGASCSGAGQSTCADNSYCASGACGYPVYPTQSECVNFYSGSHSSGPTWNPATSTGPVIYSVEHVSHGPGEFGTAACPDGNTITANCQCNPTETQWNIRIRAYRHDVAWPATRAGLSGFFYVTTSGQDKDIVASPTLLRPQIGYNNGSSAEDKEFNVYHCGSNANAFQPGYFFTGGNEICRQF